MYRVLLVSVLIITLILFLNSQRKDNSYPSIASIFNETLFLGLGLSIFGFRNGASFSEKVSIFIVLVSAVIVVNFASVGYLRYAKKQKQKTVLLVPILVVFATIFVLYLIIFSGFI